MRLFLFFFLFALAFPMIVKSQAEKFAEIWEKEHISRLSPSDVRHSDLKGYLEKLKNMGVKVDHVGSSFANREIFQLEWGNGPRKILMWSQMHGDEPTATSALIDMFAFLQKHRDSDLVKKIGEAVTIRAVPMLNPDGQEMYQRRNLQGIDINRDALDLRTPEARLLKQLRDDWMPVIGFNLHNQGALTTVGTSTNQTAISLLVVFGDEARTMNLGHESNRRLCSAIVLALQKFISGNIARYSDEWTPTAFGDNFSAWGTPTILIETGSLYGRDEMFLVKMNFIAFLTALEAIATGGEKMQDPSVYLSLPENSSGRLVNFIFRRANVVNSGDGASGSVIDIGAVTERRRASFIAPTVIRNIGQLSGLRGLEEYDASGYNVVHRFGRAKVGELCELFFYKKDRVVNWTAEDIERQYPPDAIFSMGKWTKGEKLVPRK
jgi:hypothetical protein